MNPTSLGPVFSLRHRAGIGACLFTINRYLRVRATKSFFAGAPPTIENKIERIIQNTKVAFGDRDRGGQISENLRGGVKISNFQGPLKLASFHRDSMEKRQFGEVSRDNFRGELHPPL